MAAEVRNYAVAITAGTSSSSPATTALTMPPRIVRWIRWRVPPGPRGELGWALSVAGQRIIPWGAGQWLVADDESDRLELTDQVTSGAWQLQGYNSGTYDHTVYLTFGLDPVGVVGTSLDLVPLTITP